jgi:hypothetical protein
MMSLIMDELVRVVRTAAPCRRRASARRAENVPSSYCLCRVAARAVFRVFVRTARPGQSGPSARIPGIITIPAGDQECIGVRIWPPHSPRHPLNVQDEPAHSPEPDTTPLAEEVTDTLTLGVSEIAHIPDPTPFQPKPHLPSVLCRIHEQVLGESSQGRSLLPQ